MTNWKQMDKPGVALGSAQNLSSGEGRPQLSNRWPLGHWQWQATPDLLSYAPLDLLDRAAGASSARAAMTNAEDEAAIWAIFN